MKTILIVEDDADISTLVQNVLQDYHCIPAYSGTEALLHDLNNIDLVLLDMMLPGMNGDDVLKTMRQNSTVPIIMMTSVSDSDNVVRCLDHGANDYITKPFDINILKARVAVQLRHTQSNKSQLTYRNLVLDTDALTCTVDQVDCNLSNKEFQIMRLLLENPNVVFTKERIYEAIWQDDYYIDDNTVNVHISSLRKKLREVSPDSFIQTIWGMGIRLTKVS